MRLNILAALTMAALLTCGASASAASPSLASCHNLFGSAFDCGCMTRFLETRIDPDDLEIILPLWAYSIDQSGKYSAEVDRFNDHHGYTKVNEVLRQFYAVRLELFMQCPACSTDDGDADH